MKMDKDFDFDNIDKIKGSIQSYYSYDFFDKMGQDRGINIEEYPYANCNLTMDELNKTILSRIQKSKEIDDRNISYSYSGMLKNGFSDGFCYLLDKNQNEVCFSYNKGQVISVGTLHNSSPNSEEKCLAVSEIYQKEIAKEINSEPEIQIDSISGNKVNFSGFIGDKLKSPLFGTVDFDKDISNIYINGAIYSDKESKIKEIPKKFKDALTNNDILRKKFFESDIDNDVDWDVHVNKIPYEPEIQMWGTIGKEYPTDYTGVYNYEKATLELTTDGEIPIDLIEPLVKGTAQEITETELNRFDNFEAFELQKDGTYNFVGYFGSDDFGKAYETVEGVFDPKDSSVEITNGFEPGSERWGSLMEAAEEEAQSLSKIDKIKQEYKARSDKDLER